MVSGYIDNRLVREGLACPNDAFDAQTMSPANTTMSAIATVSGFGSKRQTPDADLSEQVISRHTFGELTDVRDQQNHHDGGGMS